MPLARVELDASETQALVQLVQARLAETERMVQNLEEGEGMDLQRHNALKTLRPQIEMLQLLTLKLEAAARELGSRR